MQTIIDPLPFLLVKIKCFFKSQVLSQIKEMCVGSSDDIQQNYNKKHSKKLKPKIKTSVYTP